MFRKIVVPLHPLSPLKRGVSDRQVLFDRITWNREVVVQEASPLMCFFMHDAVYGYINANRPILFFRSGI